jgi:hypothetical protein
MKQFREICRRVEDLFLDSTSRRIITRRKLVKYLKENNKV